MPGEIAPRDPMTLTIGGVDFTQYLVARTLTIESVLTQQVDTCRFTLDPRTAASLSLTEWAEVILTDSASVRAFAGYLTAIEQKVKARRMRYYCECHDYSALLDKVGINTSYTAQTDAAILNSLFTTYLPEINATTYVVSSGTVDKIVFNRTTLFDAVKALAQRSGYDWYVDYNKNLHFFPSETNSAPFTLTDAVNYDGALTVPYDRDTFSYEPDASDIRNRIEVYGGIYLSTDTDFEFAGDDQNVLTNLPYQMWPPTGQTQILVYKNTGTDDSPTWTAQTVGVDHVDSLSSYNVLFNRKDKLLRFATAPPNLKRAVKVTCQYEVPLRARVTDSFSYAKYGRWFDYVHRDLDITTKVQAKAIAKAMLAEYALARVAGRLSLRKPGLRSGMNARIINSIKGVDDYFLLQRVTAKARAGWYFQYDVQFGEYHPDLVDVLLSLRGAAKPYIAQRPDEVLDELLEWLETIQGTESWPTAPTLTQPPYKWGSFKWGFAKWS